MATSLYLLAEAAGNVYQALSLPMAQQTNSASSSRKVRESDEELIF